MIYVVFNYQDNGWCSFSDNFFVGNQHMPFCLSIFLISCHPHFPPRVFVFCSPTLSCCKKNDCWRLYLCLSSHSRVHPQPSTVAILWHTRPSLGACAFQEVWYEIATNINFTGIKISIQTKIHMVLKI